jgi:hypothetical protein
MIVRTQQFWFILFLKAYYTKPGNFLGLDEPHHKVAQTDVQMDIGKDDVFPVIVV